MNEQKELEILRLRLLAVDDEGQKEEIRKQIIACLEKRERSAEIEYKNRKQEIQQLLILLKETKGKKDPKTREKRTAAFRRLVDLGYDPRTAPEGIEIR